MPRNFFCSLATLEEVALNPDNNRELRTLLSQHNSLVLDATVEEIDVQMADSDSILMAVLRIIGSSVLEIPGWQQVPETHIASEAAGSVFILDRPDTECEALRRRYGVCVVNQKEVQAAALLIRPLVRKEFVESDSYEATVNGELRKGWYAALTVPELPVGEVPLNALVVVDTYLFGDRGRFITRGRDNLLGLLRGLLPATLDIDFHLLLVAANGAVPFNRESFATFAQEIEHQLKRPYKLQIGLVTRPPGGKERRSITGNYYFCTSQHGFSCFRESRPEYNNDFIVNGAYEGAGHPGFDVPVRSMSTELKIAKQLLVNNKIREAAPGAFIDPTRAWLGFCDNRLLTLVT